MTRSLLLVRHAAPEIDNSEPSGEWCLTEAGRESARALGRVLDGDIAGGVLVTSDERKAIETAEEMLGDHHADRLRVDRRLREVRRPWLETGHREAVIAYLAGEELPGWEPQAEAAARFGGAVASLGEREVGVVAHGTVMTLFLANIVEGFDARRFWSELAMPDAWLFDVERRTISRPAGWST